MAPDETYLPPAEAIATAKRRGAKIYFNDDANMFVLLDMKKGSPLWYAYFNSETDAARAYLAWMDAT